MTVSITLAPNVEAKVRERAAALGTDVEGYITTLVQRSVEPPMPLEQISGEIGTRFDKSRMSDGELSEILEHEKHGARRERRGRRAS